MVKAERKRLGTGMCMQDLCLSAWRDQPYGAVDMMFKVTDICDPDVCQTPMDIKMDRDKYNSLYGGPPDPIEPTGTQGDKAIYWMFTKCWADVSIDSLLGTDSLVVLLPAARYTDIFYHRVWSRVPMMTRIGSSSQSITTIYNSRSRLAPTSTITIKRVIRLQDFLPITSASRIIMGLIPLLTGHPEIQHHPGNPSLVEGSAIEGIEKLLDDRVGFRQINLTEEALELVSANNICIYHIHPELRIGLKLNLDKMIPTVQSPA